MKTLEKVTQWFYGGDHPYHTLLDAMGGDAFWALILSALALLLLGGLAVIAWECGRQERLLRSRLRQRTLCRVRYSLMLGATGGYVIVPAAMIWPAWRIYALLLALAALVVWRVAWTRRDVKLLGRALSHPRAARSELASTRAQAKQKTFFVNALGHDLKNSLHGITLQAQVAQSALQRDDHDTVQHSLNLMRQCTAEADRLLNGFLELGRLDAGEDRPIPINFDLDSLLSALADEHQPMAEQRGLALESEISEGEQVICDRVKLERIVRNLLVNAIKYTNQGKVLIKGGVKGRSVVVDIEDTGPGIAAEEQERLFDAFYRATHRQSGSPSGHGLGLAIAWRLAQQLGGRIELDSEPGRGSRFRLVIPAVAEQAEPCTTQPTRTCIA